MMRGDDGYRMPSVSKIPLLLLACLRIGLVNALCPAPTQIADTGFTAVMIFNEVDLKALGDCEVLDGNLGIFLDTATNFTVPGLKKVNGFMSVANCPLLQRFQFPDLQEVNGDWLEIGRLPSYTDFDSFPSLKKVKYFNVNFTPRLQVITEVANANIQSVDQLVFNSTGLTDISLNQVSSTDGLKLILVNNTALKTFTMPYTGHKNASISSWGQPLDASYSFPLLAQLGTLKLAGADGRKVSAPQLTSVTRLELAGMISSLPQMKLLRDVELMFVTNSELKSASWDSLTLLKHLAITNTTVTSGALDLPSLNTMNVPGTIPPSELHVSFPWPPTSNNIHSFSLQEWEGIYVNNSKVNSINIPALKALDSSVKLTEMPCFDCKKLLQTLYAKELKPKECICESICGGRQKFYVTPSNWTEAEEEYGFDDEDGEEGKGDEEDKKSKPKAPIIGGAVAGGVALISLVVAGVLWYRRHRARHTLPSMPEPEPAPPPAVPPAATNTTDYLWGISELQQPHINSTLDYIEKPVCELEGARDTRFHNAN